MAGISSCFFFCHIYYQLRHTKVQVPIINISNNAFTARIPAVRQCVVTSSQRFMTNVFEPVLEFMDCTGGPSIICSTIILRHHTISEASTATRPIPT